MPRPGLSGRLKHMRLSRQPVSTPQPDSPPAAPGLDIPGFSRIGEFLYYRQSIRRDISAVNSVPQALIPAGTGPEQLVYFDLETTGLSSGAGTLAFLAGFGRHTAEGLKVDQYFLSDFPGEGEFLSRLRSELAPGTCLVSYNGRAYDAKLLQSRGLMNGIHFSVTAHADLLYLSRRLWRSLIGACSLGDIEREILHLGRGEDLPGIEVPDRWFGFLRDHDPAPLSEVFSHHLQDIVSLALLLQRMTAILADPLGAAGIDKRALGVWFLGREDTQSIRRGEALLASAYGDDDYRAGVLLALQRKRRRDWSGALRIWRDLSAVMTDPGVCEELAKYYEHRSMQLEKALEWAEKGRRALESGSIPGSRLQDFDKRIDRLRRKLDSGS